MAYKYTVRTTAIIAILLYAFARSFIVKATLDSYGVNPWIFLAIDATTGIIYVLGIEYLVRGLKIKVPITRTIAWGVATVLAFAAPYVYLYAAGQSMPLSLFVGLSLIVGLLAINAFFTLRKAYARKK